MALQRCQYASIKFIQWPARLLDVVVSEIFAGQIVDVEANIVLGSGQLPVPSAVTVHSHDRPHRSSVCRHLERGVDVDNTDRTTKIRSHRKLFYAVSLVFSLFCSLRNVTDNIFIIIIEDL